MSELADAAVSSAAIPLVFPPHVWEGKGIFMDGGTVRNINIDAAIEQCVDAGFSESQIILDILICASQLKPERINEVGNSWENFMRSRELSSLFHDTNSMESTLRQRPDVTVRHVVYQKTRYNALDELNFDGDFTWPA